MLLRAKPNISVTSFEELLDYFPAYCTCLQGSIQYVLQMEIQNQPCILCKIADYAVVCIHPTTSFLTNKIDNNTMLTF